MCPRTPPASSSRGRSAGNVTAHPVRVLIRSSQNHREVARLGIHWKLKREREQETCLKAHSW